MVTNDVRPLAAPGAGPVYAALVTPKGKLLHDLFIFKGPDPGAPPGGATAAAAAAVGAAAGAAAGGAAAGAPAERLLLDVDAAAAAAVLQLLSKYKLRRAITIEDAAGELRVWARQAAGGGGGGGGWHADPRLPGQLGERGVFPAGARGRRGTG